MAFALASAADLLARTNDLLHKVGINALPIPSLVELQQSASSMFVAVFEAIIQVSTGLPSMRQAPLRTERLDVVCRLA